MKLVKHRVPPFAIGLVIGTILSVVMLQAWQKSRKAEGFFPSVTEAHRQISRSDKWLNAARPVRSEELAGRWVILHFFTYSGIASQRSWLELEKLAAEYGTGIALVGVHSAKFDGEKNFESITAAVRRQGIRHLVVDDSDFRLWKFFGASSWPTIVVIDPSGKIFATYAGSLPAEALLKKMQDARAELPVSPQLPPLPMAPTPKGALPPATALKFPTKLAAEGETLWISDTGNHRLVAVDTETGEMKTVVGSGKAGFTDGDFATAEFRNPGGLVVAQKKIWVADTMNHSIRVVDLAKKTVTTIAGTGSLGAADPGKRSLARETPMAFPTDVALAEAGRALVVSMAGKNELWSIDLKTGVVRVIAGTGAEAMGDGPFPLNTLAQPAGVDEFGGAIYFVDAESSALRVLRKNGKVETIVGNEAFAFGFSEGKPERATFQHPQGVYAEGGAVFVADTLNHAIRRFENVRGLLFTVTGKAGKGFVDGKFADAKFFEPTDIERIGTVYYVADSNNNAIRIIDLNIGDVRTLVLK